MLRQSCFGERPAGLFASCGTARGMPPRPGPDGGAGFLNWYVVNLQGTCKLAASLASGFISPSVRLPRYRRGSDGQTVSDRPHLKVRQTQEQLWRTSHEPKEATVNYTDDADLRVQTRIDPGAERDDCASARDASTPTAEQGCTPPKDTCHNLELGKRGEDAAVRFLTGKGFTILERNWKCAAGEADIIAEFENWDYKEIHFIEVKTRTSTCTGFPEEAVDQRKRRRYERISEMYLREHYPGEARITFDVISLLATGSDHAYMKMVTNVLSCDCGY
jgi:putative endonuclease